MSRSWYIFCCSHPTEGSSPERWYPAWTIDGLNKEIDRIVAEILKELRDVFGIVSYPVTDNPSWSVKKINFNVL